MNTWTIGKSLKRTAYPQSKCFISNLTCWELVRVTTTMLREFERVWDEAFGGLSQSLP